MNFSSLPLDGDDVVVLVVLVLVSKRILDPPEKSLESTSSWTGFSPPVFSPFSDDGFPVNDFSLNKSSDSCVLVAFSGDSTSRFFVDGFSVNDFPVNESSAPNPCFCVRDSLFLVLALDFSDDGFPVNEDRRGRRPWRANTSRGSTGASKTSHTVSRVPRPAVTRPRTVSVPWSRRSRFPS